MQLPPALAISTAAAALLERAGDNTSLAKAINKAELALNEGIRIAKCADGWLIGSLRGEHVYRVSSVYGCPCKAGVSGRHCYHRQVIEILTEAGKYTMPRLTSRVVYAPDVSEWF